MRAKLMIKNDRTGYTKLVEAEKAHRYVAGQALIRGRTVENAKLKDTYSFA